jgi:hypothetical protein
MSPRSSRAGIEPARRDDVLLVLVLEIGRRAHELHGLLGLAFAERDPSRPRPPLDLDFGRPVGVLRVEQRLVQRLELRGVLARRGEVAAAALRRRCAQST